MGAGGLPDISTWFPRAWYVYLMPEGRGSEGRYVSGRPQVHMLQLFCDTLKLYFWAFKVTKFMNFNTLNLNTFDVVYSTFDILKGIFDVS